MTEVVRPHSLSLFTNHYTESNESSQSTATNFSRFTSLRHFAQGTYGEILVGEDNVTNKEVILKKIQKTGDSKGLNSDGTDIEREAKACTYVNNHPAFVHFYGRFDTPDYYYLSFEFLQGGDLFSLLEKSNFEPLNEEIARKIARELCEALLFLHRNGIAHRDIKLDNIMIDHSDHLFQYKLIDFGLCHFFDPKKEDLCSEYCGSEGYMSPEILSRKPYKATKADVWSLGVTLFILLFGRLPFVDGCKIRGRDGSVMLYASYPDDEEVPVSREGRHLLRLLLTNDPNNRPSILEILDHSWFSL